VPHWQNSLTKRKENNVLNPDMMQKLESKHLVSSPNSKGQNRKRKRRKQALQRENLLSKYENYLCTAKIVQIGVLMSIMYLLH
jgi:hypothetical protein